MAEYPALMLWTDAYLADTTHLSAEEHGVYLLLLMAAWRTPDCSLPDDDDRLARMARVGLKKWRQVRTVMEQFWTVENGKWASAWLLRDKATREAQAERFAKLRNSGWRALRIRVFERDGYTCVYCGASDVPLECDHIFPKSRGGPDDADNLATSCVSCNRRKHDRTPQEWQQ